MNDQLILKFPSQQAYKKEDYYVSSSNQKAYDFINSWPRWIKKIVNIYGPSGSGKSHLVSILKSKTTYLEVESKKLNDNISILDLISLTEIKISKSEIRRLISGNGIKINNQTISDEKKIINIKFFNEEGFLKLSIGKKKHIKIQLD